MAAKRGGNPQSFDQLSKRILRELKAHFVEGGLTSSALSRGYVGVPISQLKERLCVADDVSEVDFDLSLKELEDRELAKTGPMVPYENDPSSMVIVVGSYSKREYIHLTEAGYKAPTQTENAKSPRSGPSQIHISGGNFHQSQIALGEQVAQQQWIENINDAEVVERLVQLLSQSGVTIDQASKDDVTALVAAAQKGHINEAKPLFQKLFGFATEGIKQTAWGVLATLVAKAMGM